MPPKRLDAIPPSFRIAIYGAIVGVICGAATLVAHLGWLARRDPAPRLVLPRFSLDLGAGKPREVLRGSFVIENPGRAPLEFSITKNCNCTDINPLKGCIAPGDGQEVRLGVRLPNVAGHGRHLRLEILSNDPVNANSAYEVIAHCPAPLRSEPESIAFGIVQEGASRDVVLTLFDERGTQIRADKRVTIDAGDLPLLVTQSASPAGKLALVVELSAGSPRGMYHGSLRITLEDYGSSCPFYARTTGAV